MFHRPAHRFSVPVSRFFLPAALRKALTAPCLPGYRPAPYDTGYRSAAFPSPCRASACLLFPGVLLRCLRPCMPHKPYSSHRSPPPESLFPEPLQGSACPAGPFRRAPSCRDNPAQDHRTHRCPLTDLTDSLQRPYRQPDCRNPDSDTAAGILNPGQPPVPAQEYVS